MQIGAISVFGEKYYPVFEHSQEINKFTSIFKKASIPFFASRHLLKSGSVVLFIIYPVESNNSLFKTTRDSGLAFFLPLLIL